MESIYIIIVLIFLGIIIGYGINFFLPTTYPSLELSQDLEDLLNNRYNDLMTRLEEINYILVIIKNKLKEKKYKKNNRSKNSDT